MENKMYLLVYSDESITTLSKATLNADEFQKMLDIRSALKQNGASFMVVEDATQGVVDGQTALKSAAMLGK